MTAESEKKIGYEIVKQENSSTTSFMLRLLLVKLWPQFLGCRWNLYNWFVGAELDNNGVHCAFLFLKFEIEYGNLFHQDKVPVYKSSIALAAECSIWSSQHMIYSPNLAPSDYLLLMNLDI